MQGLFEFTKSNLRWLVGGMLLTVFSSFGQTFFIAQFNRPIRETFELTDGEFGLLYMAATLASAITLVFLGRVLDQYPVSSIAAWVIVCLAIACLGMAFVSSVLMLGVVLYALRLFGQGMMTHTSQTAMGKWYRAQRGRAISLTSPGHQVGEALLPAMVILLVVAVGWRMTWLLAAASLILVALPAIFLLMRVERTPQHPNFVEPKLDESKEVQDWTRGEVLKDNAFWALLLGVLAPAFIGTSVFFQQSHILKIKNWEPELFAASYVVLAVATVSFTLWGGWLVDRFRAVVLLPVFLIPMALGCFALGSSMGSWSIFAFMALLGWSYGFSSALFGTLWPEVYGVKHLGSIRAVASAAMVFASALGPGLTGLGIDNEFDFQLQLIIMGSYCLLTSGIMVAVVARLKNRQTDQPTT